MKKVVTMGEISVACRGRADHGGTGAFSAGGKPDGRSGISRITGSGVFRQ